LFLNEQWHLDSDENFLGSLNGGQCALASFPRTHTGTLGGAVQCVCQPTLGAENVF